MLRSPLVLLTISAGIVLEGSHIPPAPIRSMNTKERIEAEGYPAEIHQIQTKDNYLLTAFRIPRGRHLTPTTKRKPLILQHGILCSSDCWVLYDNCLGFILADEGFDVWLTNSRGNTYSRAHLNYTTKDKEFWNFSFHELGYYDLPATIDYILKETGEESLIYVGHSQGTAIFFVMASTIPEYHKKVRVMSALAPIAYLNNTKGAIKRLSEISRWLIDAAKIFNIHHVLDHSIVIAVADHILCTLNWEICNEAIDFIAGLGSRNIDKSILPYLADICPTGSSTKQLIHFNQLIKNGGKFTWFDYGNENKFIYNSTKPPEYNLSNVNLPVLLYYGPDDYISSVSEVNMIHSKLPKVTEFKEILTYNHLDFMWAKYSYEDLFKHMIQEINKY